LSWRRVRRADRREESPQRAKTIPEAFVVINDTYDVLGKGFKSHLIT
jgi:hypothetical protein